MSRRPLPFLLVAVLALIASVATASEVSQLEIVGASPDGRYLAFEQHGHMDGSGAPFSSIAVIDTETGQPAAASLREGFYEGEPRSLPEVRRDVRAAADSLLLSLGIDRMVTTRPLVRRLPTEMELNRREVAFSLYPLLRGWTAQRRLLKLETRPAEEKCGYYEQMSWTARLVLVDAQEGAVLADHAGIIPEPWLDHCAYGWRLGEIHELPGGTGRLVVFLGVDVPGFEGQSLRWVPVVLEAGRG